MLYPAIMEGSDDVWALRVPDLPGVFGAGPTADAAIADTISAANDWRDHMLLRGWPILPPRELSVVIADPATDFRPDTETAFLIEVFVKP
jgi:predicted RNase H-like HicB family nuclease